MNYENKIKMDTRAKILWRDHWAAVFVGN